MTPTRPWKSALHLHVAQLELRSPDGLRVLCVGAVPGAAYVAPEWTV